MMMWLVIIVMSMALIFAMDWAHWQMLLGPGWSCWKEPTYEEPPSDMQIRAEYRKLATEMIPDVSATDPIFQPDPKMEDLLDKDKTSEARSHLYNMLRLSHEMRDMEALRKYSIYAARLAWRESEVREMARIESIELRKLQIRQDMKKYREEDLSPPVRLQLAGAVEEVRAKFLDFGHKGLMLNRPPRAEAEVRNEKVLYEHNLETDILEIPEKLRNAPPLWKKMSTNEHIVIRDPSEEPESEPSGETGSDEYTDLIQL